MSARPTFVPALLAALLLASPTKAPAGPPDASPPASASASASPAPEAAAKPFDAAPIPDAKSPVPKPAEWAAAPRVTLTRTGPAAADCKAYRVREWLKVRCAKLTTSAISLLGGAGEISFWIDPPDKTTLVPGGGEVMFPMRKGDRRVVQLATFGEGYDGPLTVLPALILHASWIDGESAPIVLIR